MCPGGKSIQNKLCASSIDECPISQVAIVSNSFSKEHYHTLPFTGSYKLAFSSASDHRPITQFRVDFPPCFAGDKTELPDEALKRHDPALMIDGAKCQEDEYVGLTVDPRFRSIGFLSEFQLESHSGVLQTIKDYPHSSLFFDDIVSDKQRINYKILTKEADYFDRFCEIYGAESRGTVLAAMQVYLENYR